MRIITGTEIISRPSKFLLLVLLPVINPHARAVDDSGSSEAPRYGTAPTGEPYELAGKRLVFANWYYVRPGKFSWRDAKENIVTANAQPIGPLEAHMVMQDSPRGIRLVMERPQRSGPLLQPERPWEKEGINFITLIHDLDRYRAWGGCQAGKSNSFCYFESSDGLKWTRPELGLVEFEGSSKNNLIDVAAGSVFIDPSSPPEERYKAVRLSDKHTIADLTDYIKRRPKDIDWRSERGDINYLAYPIMGAVSADGLHWKLKPEPLIVEHSDTLIVAYYDSILRKYVIYTRNWMVGPQSANARDPRRQRWLDMGRRSIGRTESDHFGDFPLSDVILEPGPDMAPSDVLYTNCKTTIPGAPDQHLLFPTVWHTSDDTTTVVAASSHNGKVWHYLPGPPVLETANFGEWDGGSVFASPNLVELPDGAWALPYSGFNFPHKYPRGSWAYRPGYVLWPKGRMVALEAKDQGEFATVGLVPPGRRLRMNAVTQRGGRILVEVADIDGKTRVGHSFQEAVPIIGDQYRTPVTWGKEGRLVEEAGEPIILRFRMEKARIYWLDFE
ncbi:MAG: hypothetical protein HY232_13600 [Acidobacteria bacterium]|nr:hypothetical protein [Acidobacteriota bacterium]